MDKATLEEQARCKHKWDDIGLSGIRCNKCDKLSSWYLETLAKLEPNLSMIDAGAFYASAAVSLKRIADALENTKSPPKASDFPLWVSNHYGVVAAFDSEAEAVAFANKHCYRVDKRRV